MAQSLRGRLVKTGPISSVWTFPHSEMPTLARAHQGPCMMFHNMKDRNTQNSSSFLLIFRCFNACEWNKSERFHTKKYLVYHDVIDNATHLRWWQKLLTPTRAWEEKGIKYILPGYVFMIIIPLIWHISKPQLHNCIEEICGSIIFKNERFSSRISQFWPFKIT